MVRYNHEVPLTYMQLSGIGGRLMEGSNPTAWADQAHNHSLIVTSKVAGAGLPGLQSES